MSDEREDWQALLASPGWGRVVAHARALYAGEGYGRAIKLAISNALTEKRDVAAAVAAVDAASEAVNQVLSLPADRFRELSRHHDSVSEACQSRRGGL